MDCQALQFLCLSPNHLSIGNVSCSDPLASLPQAEQQEFNGLIAKLGKNSSQSFFVNLLLNQIAESQDGNSILKPSTSTTMEQEAWIQLPVSGQQKRVGPGEDGVVSRGPSQKKADDKRSSAFLLSF